MEMVEGTLRANTASYSMWRMVCPECNRTHPETAKRCHPCNNANLSVKCCTFESRIAEYFAALRTCELWPSSKHGSLSAGELVPKMAEILNSVSVHKCNGAELCPLKRETIRLKERALSVLGGTKGVTDGVSTRVRFPVTYYFPESASVL